VSFHTFYTLQYIRSEEYSVAALNSDAGLHGGHTAKHMGIHIYFISKCYGIKVEVTLFLMSVRKLNLC